MMRENEWAEFYTGCSPDFGKFYSSFVYDESADRYVYTGEGIETNSIFGNWNVNYLHAEMKIIGGRISYIRACFGLDDGTYTSDLDIYCYGFGATSVTLPEAQLRGSNEKL